MSFEIDRFSHIESPVQRWDPRFKMASLILLIFVIAFVETLPVAVLSFMTSVCIYLFSRLPASLAAEGLKWVGLFLLPFFILLPLSYPGAEQTVVAGISISVTGFRFALLIFIKSISIIIICYSLFGSVRFHHSMVALRRLRCPQFMVNMLLFSYRYIFVLIEEMHRGHRAIISRGFQPKLNRNTLTVIGYFVWSLLIRSFDRTERIHAAMLSKGYTGEFHILAEFQSSALDQWKSAAVIGTSMILLALELSHTFLPATKSWL